MRGEPFILNKIVLNHPDNPITDIGDKTALKIIDIIQDEYWNEFRRRLDFSTNPVIVLDNLGCVFPRYSPLKGQIRNMIRFIRRLDKRIQRQKDNNKNFDPLNSMTVAIRESTIVKLRASLAQLDQMRITRIARIMKWNEKQRLLGTPERIKIDYATWGLSFTQTILNNIKNDPKLIALTKI